MTRDEYRAKCIEAMKAAYARPGAPFVGSLTPDEIFTRRMTAAFDALHGIARVVPVEITEEMMEAVDWQYPADLLFDTMSAAGDLTKPPEKKP